MELLMLVVGLVVFDLLAMRFGYDSRDVVSAMTNRENGNRSAAFDSSYDEVLAREIREARQHRVARGRVADSRLQPRQGDRSLAA